MVVRARREFAFTQAAQTRGQSGSFSCNHPSIVARSGCWSWKRSAGMWTAKRVFRHMHRCVLDRTSGMAKQCRGSPQARSLSFAEKPVAFSSSAQVLLVSCSDAQVSHPKARKRLICCNLAGMHVTRRQSLRAMKRLAHRASLLSHCMSPTVQASLSSAPYIYDAFYADNVNIVVWANSTTISRQEVALIVIS